MRWATPQLHDIGALERMVDPVLEGAYPAKSLSRLADVVASCVQVRHCLSSSIANQSAFWGCDFIMGSRCAIRLQGITTCGTNQ